MTNEMRLKSAGMKLYDSNGAGDGCASVRLTLTF